MPSPKTNFPRQRFFIILTLITLLHGYLAWQLLPPLATNTFIQFIGIAYLFLSAIMIPLGLTARFVVFHPALADLLSWVGSLCLGFFSSLLILTLLRELLLVFSSDPWLTADSAVFVPILAILITTIGFINARRLPRIVEICVPIKGLPAALQNFSIVQITDLHIGPTIKRAFVAAVVERVNMLQADVIAVTGDMIDGKVDQLTPHTAPLANLRARYGVYMVPGNHEYYSGVTQWLAEFRRLGMRTLSNEHVVITHYDAQLILAGVTDFNAEHFDIDQHSDPAKALIGAPIQSMPKILLAHQPRSALKAEAAGFDLQLSGHTHGGQFWPWNLFVPMQQPFTAGLHRMGRLWVYTSRGTGYWGPPKRFGAPSEITRIKLIAG